MMQCSFLGRENVGGFCSRQQVVVIAVATWGIGGQAEWFLQVAWEATSALEFPFIQRLVHRK